MEPSPSDSPHTPPAYKSGQGLVTLTRAVEAATVTVIGAAIGRLFGQYIDSALWGGIYAASAYLACRFIVKLWKAGLRYRLRTLVIVLTLGPPAMAAMWYGGQAMLLAPLLVMVLAAWSET